MIGVIFDMDGTLINSQRITVPWWELAGQKQGIEGLGAHIPNVCGMNLPGWTGYLKEHLPTLDMDQFLKDMVILKEHFPPPLRLMQGAETLLENLSARHIPMGVASGSNTKTICNNLQTLGILSHFAATVGGERVQQGKPAPDIFLLAAAEMGVAPEHCYVLEDSPLGIEAAYKAGMRGIFIPDLVPANKTVEKYAFALCESLDKTIPLIEEF